VINDRTGWSDDGVCEINEFHGNEYSAMISSNINGFRVIVRGKIVVLNEVNT